MTSRTRLAGGVAALVLATVSPAGASPSRPAPVSLGRTVVLSGSTSYVRDVVIGRAVTVSAYESWKMTAPRGRFAGFALRPAGSDELGTWFAVRSGYCVGRGCTRTEWASGANACFCGWQGSDGMTATLRPGRYRLYLIADGAPATVTITLPSLTGSTSIRSGTPHRTTIDTPKPAQYEPATPAGLGGNLYSATSSHSSPGSVGMHVLLMWKLIVGPPRSANNAGYCLVEDGADRPCDARTAPSAAVYGQSETGRKTGPGGALDEYFTNMEVFGVRPEGEWAFGGYINSPSPATEAHALVFWMDFTG